MKISDLTLENFPIGVQKDWKPKLSTIAVYRSKEDEFELDITIDGWQSCVVNLDTMQKLVNSEIDTLDLDWK